MIFSDGEDHEKRALELAELAKEAGVIIHTIGMGTTSGVPIPMFNSKGSKTGFKSDQSGNTVLTKLNENVLINVADAGGGSYTRAQGYSIGLDGLVAAINEVEKSDLNKDKFLTYEDHFQIFLLLGILCLLADVFITERSTFGFGKSKIA